MANDLHPYYPRQVTRPPTIKHGWYDIADAAAVFGQPAAVLEIPVSWDLDDFPAMDYISRIQQRMTALGHLEEQWRAIFDYAASEEEGCCYTLTIHPQTSGRAHMIQLLDRLISYMHEQGAEFMTLSEIADATEIQRLEMREVLIWQRPLSEIVGATEIHSPASEESEE